MKKVSLLSVLVAVLVVWALGGCDSSDKSDMRIEKMTEHARAIVRAQHPQYNMNLFAVFAQTSENPELFENADEIAYWRFILTASDNEVSAEVVCTNGAWSVDLLDDIWIEDSVLGDPLDIEYDIQDALDLIGNTYPDGKYYGIYFHKPLNPDIEHPQYKFHRESMDFIIFDAVTGDFHISLH